MPAAVSYIVDTHSSEYREVEEMHTHEYDARAKAIGTNWAYYDGQMPAPLKVEGDQYDDNILLSKVDQVADKCLSFLMGDGITFNAGEEEETEEDRQIAELWRENRGDILLHNIGLSGVMAGHCFVRVEPREGLMPKIVNLDPRLCSVFWDAFDVDRVLWYRLQFTSGRTGKRVDYVRQSAMEPSGDDEVWVEVTYSQRDGGPWQMGPQLAFPFCPVIDWQNMPRPHGYYGIDDVSKAVALNDAVNFVISNYNRILKHHGSPKTIGIGMDASDVVASAVGGFYTVNKPSGEANIYNLEMQSDLTSARELLALVLREIWQSARMVDPQTIKDSVGQLTNFALRVLYQDALSKTTTKRLLYGEGFAEINKLAFLLMGREELAEVKTVWPDVLPEDPAEVSQALLAELAAGIISRESYRDIRGYDSDQEDERIKEEKAGEDTLGSRLLSAFERGQ